jgi:hypothetical protein
MKLCTEPRKVLLSVGEEIMWVNRVIVLSMFLSVLRL